MEAVVKQERVAFDTAFKSLRGRIDVSSKEVTAQDFRHNNGILSLYLRFLCSNSCLAF